jgi:AraC-like DNA-binding protein
MIGNFIPFDPYFVIFGFITLFSFVFSFYSIRQPVIFDQELKHGNDEKRDSEKYLKSGLKENQARDYLAKLISYVEVNKPYLNRDLSIYDLSQATGIPRHYITQILNEKHKKNLYTFINEYRVKEVIERLSDPKFNNYTILAIAYDAGFNSKTTFNAIFKNQTGLTPSEFRDKSNSPSSK